MKLSTVLLATAVAASLGGCYGTLAASDTTPDLVYVDPGVQVVVDADYPVFYSDNAYWRYDGGVWYQSRWQDRGWARSGNVPVAVRNVPHPETYAHYNSGARDHRTAAPAPAAVREQRAVAPAPAAVREQRAVAPAPAAVQRTTPAPHPAAMGNRAPSRPAPRKKPEPH